MILYRRSTCNKTDKELLLVLAGPYDGARVTATLKWIISVLASLGSKVMVKFDTSSCGFCAEISSSMTFLGGSTKL